MAVLPVDNFGLGSVARSQTEPSLTWYIDRNTGRIRGECDGLAAVRQAVEIIVSTERFRWQIYRPSSGVDYDNLIGMDPGYVAVELQRRLTSALSMDTRVTGISNYKYQMADGILDVSFTVDTVFGAVQTGTEVSIA